MRSTRHIAIVALALAGPACESRYDPPPAYASTRAAAGHPPALEGITHAQLLPSPSPAVMFGPWTLRAPDSIAALVAILQQIDSAWQPDRPDPPDLPYTLYTVNLYRGADLVATLTAQGTRLQLEGEFGSFEQTMSDDDFARLNAVLGVGVEVVPVPPREAPR